MLGSAQVAVECKGLKIVASGAGAAALACLNLLVALGARSQRPRLPRAVAMAADGLPAEIPRPSSPRPTDAEWSAVPREIRTFGEAPLDCEAKMVREWLRAYP